MVSINTNLSSFIAQNSLNKNTNSLNQAIERMSTGFKINHASDNAANYSISTNMTKDLSSYYVAEDNVKSGLDLVMTAQDTLSLMSDHCTRIRDLCMQARNGTYGGSSIDAIQTEVNARVSEIARLYNTTEYNGINLLNKTSATNSTAGLEHDITPKANGFIDDIEVVTPDVVVTDPTQLASAIANNTIIGIANAETLAKLAELVNSGTTCSGKTITLTADIDLSAYSTGEGWTPIGNSNTFKGNFDGQGHKVKNLYINRLNSHQGLFGSTYGQLKNIGIENCNITGWAYTGGLVGLPYSSVTNCYSTGDVIGTSVTGGLVGDASHCPITDCYAAVNVTGTGNYVGGLVGYSILTYPISNCYATGNVSGMNFVGGLVGGQYADITNCYSTGDVIGTGDYIGGLAGSSYSISNSYTTGDVKGENYVGGLTGDFYACNDCISYSKNITGNSNVGSLLGVSTMATGTITNCKTTQIEGLNKVGNTDLLDSEISYLPKTSTTLQVGINSDDSSQISFNTDLSFGLVNQLKSLNVTSKNSLDFIDNFITQISDKATELGAVQNRLESAIESISVNIDNLISSRSTLRDADIAKESSSYIRAQILQQASATLLSTANQSSSVALTLLGRIRM